MTAFLLIKCDGTFPQPGRGACGAFLPLPAIRDLDATRKKAIDAGWSLGVDADLCPSHVRMEAGA